MNTRTRFSAFLFLAIFLIFPLTISAAQATSTCGPQTFTPQLTFFSGYLNAEYSPEGYLSLHFKNNSSNGETFSLGSIAFDDRCALFSSQTGSFPFPFPIFTINVNGKLSIPFGDSDWSIRFTSMTHLDVWDDQQNVILRGYDFPTSPPNSVLPAYTSIGFSASRSDGSFTSPAFKIKQDGAPPSFPDTALRSSGCPAITGSGSFDPTYERAEYVNGLLRVHLRLNSPGIPFAFRSVLLSSGNPCVITLPPISSMPFTSFDPSYPLMRYFSIRFTTPGHWVMWNDDSDVEIQCSGCQGDLNPSVNNAYVYWVANDGGNIHTLRTTPFSPVEPATTTPACTVNCNSNVLFLPGIEGSRLFAPGAFGENQIWEPTSLTGNDVTNLDMTNSSSANSVYAKKNGIIDFAYSTFGIYAPLINQLNGMKLSGDIQDWQPIAYDWRLDYQDLINYGNETGDGKIYYRGTNAATSTPYIIQELKNLASSSRTGKVTIVAHSNGGLVAKELTEVLGPAESAKLIDKIMFVAVPSLGTPKAIGGILHGYDQAIPSKALQLFLSEPQARTIAQNMPLAYNLLPTDQYFHYTDNSVVTFDPVSMPDWLIKYSDATHPGAGIHSRELLRNFMTDESRGNPNPADTATPSVASSTLFDSATVVHSQLDIWTPPQGIQFITIAGWGNETVSGIKYMREQNGCTVSSSGACIVPTFSSQVTFKPQVVIDGDGTVVESSAQWANSTSSTRYWVNLDAFNGSLPQTGPLSAFRTKHANIFEVDQLDEFLTNLIKNSDAPLAHGVSQYVSASKPVYTGDEPRLHFTLHSPLTLGFIDQNGNYTGSTATTTIFTIPGVDYERFGEVQWLSVPKSLAGKVIMRGTGSGSFALDIESVNGNNILATTTFAAVPSGTSTIATLVIDPSVSPTASSTLAVDYDGNGTVDTTFKAKQGSIVLPDLVAPEAIISVSTSTKDIVVTGIDDISPTTATKTATTTTITDQSGNKTTLYFQKTFNGNILTYAKITGINYGTSTTALPSSFLYVWDSTKTLISQTLVVNSQFAVEALYDKKKDKTTILVKKKGAPIQTTTLVGLRLVKLTTSKGMVNYSW